MHNQNVIDVKEIKSQPMTLNSVHGEYAKFSPAEIEQKAKEKLRSFIADGQRRAVAGLQRIQSEVPVDRIVPVQKLQFLDDGAVDLRLGEQTFGLHKHARQQFGQRLGLPGRFMNDMLAEGPWGRKLVAHNLTELAANAPADKLLVREVGGQVRGVLSASYRTDDSRPALDALLNVCREVGAVVADAHALDTQVSVKIMKGEPVELYPGEWAVFGIDYRTSDYGCGARELMGWILRLLCINGAVVTTNFRKIHLGAKIKDEAEYSSRTKRLNEEFTASATRDMARALLGPAAIEKMVGQVRAAAATELDADKALAGLKKVVSKDEEKRIVEKFNSPDIELLPQGNTAWRFSNAISWLANQVEDTDRKLELEQIAGKVVEDAAIAKKAA